MISIGAWRHPGAQWPPSRKASAAHAQKAHTKHCSTCATACKNASNCAACCPHRYIINPDIQLLEFYMLQNNFTYPATATNTSAQSLAGIGLPARKNELDKVFDIVLAAQRSGVDDMSGKEIQARYELIHSKRIDSGTVSARCNELITASRLQRCIMTRPCRITGKDIHPVRVPLTQSCLVA
jgi:hypothetical protein